MGMLNTTSGEAPGQRSSRRGFGQLAVTQREHESQEAKDTQPKKNDKKQKQTQCGDRTHDLVLVPAVG